MDNATLLHIIERCRQNDRLYQEKLYRLFYNYGMTVVSRYASNRDDASEILNDAFVRAMQNLDKYKEEFSFKAWFNKILVRSAINHYRRFTLHRIDAQQFPNENDFSFEPDVFSQLSAEDLLQMVQNLPPAYRLAFNLYAIEGYTHPEIAEMLGISEGTSKSNLSKARAKLVQMLQEQDAFRHKKMTPPSVGGKKQS